MPDVFLQGPNKPKLKKELQKYDVIITTFQSVSSASPLWVPRITNCMFLDRTLALEWPDERVAERKKRKKQKKKDQDSDDFIDSDSGKEEKTKMKVTIPFRKHRVSSVNEGARGYC